MTHIPDEAVQAKRHLIQSYNWYFKSTGIDAIDDILSSIADAAESYHNTSQWEDEGHIDRIQKYADVAAYHLSAPCAVEVMDIEEKLLSEMSRRFHNEKYLWDSEKDFYPNPEYLPVDDTQIGIEFALEFMKPFLSCVVTMPVDVAAVREKVAREICLSYGQDPDDYASLCDVCGPNNEPRPQWHMHIEQAEAAIRALSAEPA